MIGPMEKIKVVAFDCDGVMFDTEKANKAFYNHILNQFGRPDMTPEQFAYASMHTAERCLNIFSMIMKPLKPPRNTV